MAVIHVPGRGPVGLGETIGSGAEGTIFEVRGTADVCVKLLYDDRPDLGERLDALMTLKPALWRGDHREHLHVAWPLKPALNGDGVVCGYVMPRVEGKLLEGMFDAHGRLGALAEPTWRTAFDVAARTARLFQKLHDVDIVLGDVSAGNIMVTPSGHVTLIDCDTVQFRDPRTGRVWPATKVTPEYAPPGPVRPDVRLQPSHDLFGLGILVARLLMEGQHPFEGVPVDGRDLTIDQNIAFRINRLTHPELLVAIRWAFEPAALPPDVLALLLRCFGPGHDDPNARPIPAAWLRVLDRAGYELRGCTRSERHLYHSSLSDCVWCQRSAAGLGDSYPSAQGNPAPATSTTAVRDAAQTSPTSHPPFAAPTPSTATSGSVPRPPTSSSSSPSRNYWGTAIAVIVGLLFLILVLRSC